MNLPFPHGPIVFFLSLESSLTQQLAATLLQKKINIAVHYKSKSSSLPSKIKSCLLQLEPEALTHFSGDVYSAVIDPYLHDESSFISPTDLYSTLKFLSHNVRQTIYVTSSSLLSNKTKTPQWIENSNQLEKYILESKSIFSQHSFKMIYTSDLYSTQMSSKISPLSHMFTKLPLSVVPFAYSGDELVRPIFDQDIIFHLENFLFGQHSSHQLFSISGKKPMYSLNFAYHISEAFKNFYQKSVTRKDESIYEIIDRDLSQTKEIFPKTSTKLIDAFNQIFLSIPQVTPSKKIIKKENVKKKQAKSSNKIIHKKLKKTVYASMLIIFALCFAIASIYVISSIIPKHLNSHLVKSSNQILSYSPIFQFTNKISYQVNKKISTKIIGKVNQLQFLSSERIHLHNILLLNQPLVNQSLVKFYDAVIKSSGNNINNVTSLVASKAQQQNLLNEPLIQQSRGVNYAQQNNYSWSELARLASIFPDFTNSSGQANIAVLIQNDQELRPTGGYLSQVIILSFDHSRLINVELHDVNQLDAQLNGHVEPPADLKNQLGESSWFLRDSNWSPEFNKSASKAAWFIQKQTNIPIYGVIGITTSGLSSLMGDSSLEINNFGQVNSDNFQHQLFYQADTSQNSKDIKREFLPEVVEALRFQLTSLEGDEVVEAFQAASTALSKGQILLYSSNTSAQSIFSELNLAGGIKSGNCNFPQDITCISQTFYLNETNVGINQVNAYIVRNQEHETTILSDSINHQHSLVLGNFSPTQNFPGGVYKSYLRYYLPKYSKVNFIHKDQKLFNQSNWLEVDHPSFKVIGVPAVVGVGETKTFEINYSISHKVENLQAFQQIFVKQPGVPKNPLTYSLKPMGNKNLIQINNFDSSQTLHQTFDFDSTTTLLFAFE